MISDSIWSFAQNQLHIPDGFLSVPVALVGWALAIVVLTIALRATRESLGESLVPLMGILAAFVFAAQAINFPVAAGTSGHLLGGALAGILLGPWPATLVMTAVIGVQALVFQDGGLLAMGWNILNMGALTVIAGWATHRLLAGERSRRSALAAFLAGWVSVELSAVATSIQLAASGTARLELVLPAMAGVHALIGVGEGLITAAALGFLRRALPRVQGAHGQPRGARWVLLGLLLALVLALLAPWASTSPDGLEAIAQRQGFLARASEPLLALLPDYRVPQLRDEALATALAVAFGTLLVAGATALVSKRLKHSGAGRD